MPGEETPNSGLPTASACEREPIHIPGSIQPHGCLVVLDPAHGTVIQYAGDVRSILGADFDDPLGRPLSDLVGASAAERLMEASRGCTTRPSALTCFERDVSTASGAVDAMLHSSASLPVIEFEAARSAGGVHATIAMVQGMLASLEAAGGLEAYHQACVEQVRALTGFDRVMIYQFLEDGSGKVIAESHPDDMESYLDLHYPESDIPQQARALYLSNWIRMIPDVTYTPAPLRPPHNPLTGQPLDLSYAIFRSVSPVHLQYLRNMGVAASMSISIVQGDRLWGLIACHHRTPRFLPCGIRAACELFGHVFSLQLESRLHAEDYEYRLQQRSVHQNLVARLSAAEDIAAGLIRSRPNLLDLVRADGAAVWFDGTYTEVGRTPGPAGVQRIVRFLNERNTDGLFVTDRLGREIPEFASSAGDVAGLLAISISRRPMDYVFWFRTEVIEAVTWAGNPAKATERSADGRRLTPRHSFAAWRETVRGRSRPWKDIEIAAAGALRVAMHEVVLTRIDELARERARAQERQALLVAELDHRVKNTLANIQALVRHSRQSSESLDAFVESLEQRIRSMAHAQNLLSESRWRGAELRPLVEEELQQFGGQGVAEIEGPRILLKPRAALSISMVIHELATNAAKFGALSAPGGRLGVGWSLERERLRLWWRESGGPPVAPPTRRGFGRMMIETSVGYELGGMVDLRFEPGGVDCTITLPFSLVEDAGAARAAAEPEAGMVEMEPLSLLLVEDSIVTALDVAERLRRQGHAVVGPTGRVGDALSILERQPVDLAILDINLGEDDSFPIADRLREMRVPFLFLTGYDASLVLPPRFAGTPCIPKPFDETALAGAIRKALERAV